MPDTQEKADDTRGISSASTASNHEPSDRSMFQREAFLAGALEYAAAALPVFPCRNAPGQDGHKAPLTARGFKDATTDPEQIKAWGREHPNALIGMPTGSITGIGVLDIDIKNGKDGFLYVPGWEELSPLRSKTQSGGAHLYFRAHEPIRSTSNVNGFPGVDTRGEGGYVIVAPSPGYEWVTGSGVINPALLPPFPAKYLAQYQRSEISDKGLLADEPELIAPALRAIPNDDVSWDEHNRIGMATYAASGGSDEGFEAFDNWSQKSAKYDSRETAKRWEHYRHSPPNQIGMGALRYAADRADPDWLNNFDRQQEAAAVQSFEQGAALLADMTGASYTEPKANPAPGKIDTGDRPTDNSAETLDLIDAGTLAGKSVQPMQFMIHKLVPANLVTLMTAQGGGGKSYITLQLCAATSLGALAYGQQTISAPAIYITAEDDADENHRRLIGVANALNTSIDSFSGKLFLVSLVERREKGIARVDAQSNKLTVLKLFHEVRASILKVGARFVVLDNVAHLFEGNENIRAHVAAFLGLLNSLALETRCAIILISHPNKAGDSFSGSTAFQNQVRSHIHLDVDPNDPDARTLKLMKANYARLEEPLRLRWHKGSFRLEDSIPAHENTATSRDRLADQLFLTCLDARNATQRSVSKFVQAGATYAPKALALMTQAKGMSVDMFESAMERLLSAGVIDQVTLDYDKPNSPGHRATGLNKIGVLEASDEPF